MSCSRTTMRSGAYEARTSCPSVSSQALYHSLIHCAPYNNFKLRLNIIYKYVILTLLNDVITFLMSLKCNYNVTQVIYTVFFQFQFQIPIIRHKSFVSPAPRGRGIAGLLTFHFLEPHCRAKFVVNFLLNAPPPGG